MVTTEGERFSTIAVMPPCTSGAGAPALGLLVLPGVAVVGVAPADVSLGPGGTGDPVHAMTVSERATTMQHGPVRKLPERRTDLADGFMDNLPADAGSSFLR
jgi:hypothetical protein